MTLSTVSLLRAGVFGAAVLGYAVVANITNSRPPGDLLTVALSLGPVLLLAAVLAWRHRTRRPIVGLCALGALLAAYFRVPLARHVAWIDLLEQVAIYGSLALMFGRSLRANRVALCTVWATQVHGPLPVEAVRYTRRVTAAWTWLFTLVTFALVVLFAVLPRPLWSAIANFGVFPLILGLFVGEYLVRGRALPMLPRVSILEGLRAYLGSAERWPSNPAQ